MAKLRNAPSTTAAQSLPPAKTRKTRAALKEKTNTTRSQAPVYDDDGDTTNLVKEAPAKPPKRSTHKASSPAREYTMAGALGTSDTNAPASTDPLARLTSDVAPSTDPLARSDGVEVEDAPVAAKGQQRRPARTKRKIAQSEAQSKMFAGMRKRMEATAKGQVAALSDEIGDVVVSKEAVSKTPAVKARAAKRVSSNAPPERSEFSISPSPPPQGRLGTIKGGRISVAPGSALRTHGTPAMDTSVLKNFKRRPRQQSMLQMVKQRQSLAQQSRMLNDESVYDLEADEDEIEDDFAPEAEGTPLRASKAMRRSSAIKSTAKKPGISKAAENYTPEAVPVSKKRKSDEARSSSGALDALRKRRKSGPAAESEAMVEDSQKGKTTGPSIEAAHDLAPEVEATPNVQVIGSSPIPSSPLSEPGAAQGDVENQDHNAIVPSTEEQQAEAQTTPPNDADNFAPPQDLDDEDHPNATLADPASSSPPPDDLPPNATQRTDVFADPLTQRTPSPPRETRKKAKPEPKPLTTAKLQALLPKRRARRQPERRRTEFDLPSGTEDEEELEEETETETRTRRRTKAAGKKGTKAAPKPKAKSRSSKPIAPTRKLAATCKRTYGRQTTSDKENDGDAGSDEGDSVLPEITVSSAEVSKSVELEAARRKFAEIDQWDMEFESLGGEEGRSSSQEWR